MTGFTKLHQHHHDDYAVAKEHILRQLGETSDLGVFGDNVLIAVYIRPQVNSVTGLLMTTKLQAEDIYSGKTGMVVKLGFDAFQDDPEELERLYGPLGAPKIGDWIFHVPSVGVSLSLCGSGSEKIKEKDARGNEYEIYDFHGWPCRLVPAREILGRLDNPHVVL